MNGGRTARHTLSAALGLAALAASGCVDEVVVGSQPSPITSFDAGVDAQTPEPDAGGALDAWTPEPDAARPDAAPPPPDAGTPDSGPPPSDAGADDGGPIVVVLFADAGNDPGCSVLECAPDAGGKPDAGRLGPCFSCDPVSIQVAPDFRSGTCDGGLDEVCWLNPDDTCLVQCPPSPTCAATSDCAADEYCYFPRSDCGEGTRGYCAPRPQTSCDTIGNPVCGCDGRVYENGCYALKAGVAVAGPGHDSCELDGGS
jgi:hypothetical protein